jgi:hypothetical protein
VRLAVPSLPFESAYAGWIAVDHLAIDHDRRLRQSGYGRGASLGQAALLWVIGLRPIYAIQIYNLHERAGSFSNYSGRFRPVPPRRCWPVSMSVAPFDLESGPFWVRVRSAHEAEFHRSKGGGLPEIKSFRCFFCNEVATTAVELNPPTSWVE